MVAKMSAQLIVPRDHSVWRRGFAGLPEDAMEAAEEAWGMATDLFFDRTQMYVHVITGDLKRSGRQDTRREGELLIGEVTYGGERGQHGDVDYAQYEHDRGGEHAFMERGWEEAERAFSRAIPDVWDRVVGGWR